MAPPIHIQDLRVYICDGHRPAHDSAAFASGVALTEREYYVLTARISRYLETCRKRRCAEGRDRDFEKAAKALDSELRGWPWFSSVGLSTSSDGGPLLIVYLRVPANKRIQKVVPEWSTGPQGRRYPVALRVMGELKAL